MKSGSKLKSSLKGKKVLLTGGPTWVPIDGMRVIGNLSSGQLAQKLALGLAAQGAQVVLLEGPVQTRLRSSAVRVVPFTFFDDLKSELRKELAKPQDIVIHAAAVSDYKLKRIHKSKISSLLKSLKLEFVPTEKLITRIKKAVPGCLLVGFKLESRIDPRSALSVASGLLEKAKCDLVVANSLQKNIYKGFIVNRDKDILAEAHSRDEMVEALLSNLIKLMADGKR